METFKVLERILLLQILPKEGDLTTIKIVRDLRAELSFSEEEHEKLAFGPPCRICGAIEEQHEDEHEFISNVEALGWMKDADGNDAVIKEYELGAKARSLIKDSLNQLSQHKKLTEQHLPLWERFMDGDEKKRNKKKK